MQEERNLNGPKKLDRDELHSFVGRAPTVVMALAIFIFLSGCSGILAGDPREQANEAISEANEEIVRHNELFAQARDTYGAVKEEVESGGDPSEQGGRITEARENLEEARSNLEEARASLARVQELDVEQIVKDYAQLLSEAMDAQLAAEAREIEFYEILQQDPSLERRREEAQEVLSEVGDRYEEAEAAYARARELADSNSRIIGPQDPNESQG